MKKMAAAFSLGMILLADVSLAQPLAEAEEAYSRGDYTTALRLWRPLANQGTMVAEFWVGFMYGEGKGVPQDYAEAAKWFRKAADQGDSASQSFLGTMYAHGNGVRQDYVESAKWYRRAADQELPSAEDGLGNAYSTGRAYHRTTPRQ
jgi:TPR repeat protein